jgi:hypothetical protein
MENKKIIKIYCDNGADVKELKKKTLNCSIKVDFLSYRYDTRSDGERLRHSLATPSAVTWEHDYTKWEENDSTWEECTASDKFDQIKRIIGELKQYERDVLHLDSAYKTKVDIFITSDKDDIFYKKEFLEPLLGFRIFFHKNQTNPNEIFEYIENLNN